MSYRDAKMAMSYMMDPESDYFWPKFFMDMEMEKNPKKEMFSVMKL